MHDHASPSQMDKSSRASEAKTVTIVGSIVNLVLAIGKFIAGIVGGSAAMVADAVHSLSDLVTDLMVYISVHIASQEADEDHPYGHGRAETIGAAATGAALIIVGLFLILDIANSLLEGDLNIPTWPALLAAIISIISKEILYHYTVLVGRKYENQTIIANAWHHRSDALSSVAAFAGIGGAMMGFPLLDPLAALIVVVLIVKVGGEICWGALKDLMDTSLSPDEMRKISKVISQTNGVNSFHELRSRRLGGDKFIDVHIEVQSNISITEAHNIAETVRYHLKKMTGATDALVHIDAERDLNYKIINMDRAHLDYQIRELAKEEADIKEVSQLVIHYLAGKVLAEFSVVLDNGAKVGHCKEVVTRLKESLETNTKIHKAAIKLKLTDEIFDQTAVGQQNTKTNLKHFENL